MTHGSGGQVGSESLASATARGKSVLHAAGIPPAEAGLDARVLAQWVLGWDAARFLANSNQPSPPAFVQRYEALLARRAAREPVAYILGRQEFWGLTFEVTPAVLIPRPETEIIVEAALALFPRRDAAFAAADVCSGSGCIAIALAHARPQVDVIASDLSREALAVAQRNAAAHAVDGRVRLVAADLMNGVDGLFDLILSNPPYVPLTHRQSLPPEVREHEPEAALFGGSDGMRAIQRLVPEAAARLRPGGVLIFEFGMGQAAPVSELISGTPGLTLLELRQDLQGIPRTAVVRKSDV